MLENMEGLFLAVDEIVDGGYVFIILNLTKKDKEKRTITGNLPKVWSSLFWSGLACVCAVT